MRKLLICFACVLLTAIRTSAQDGMPFIINYTEIDYKAHNKNFDILAADKGIVYVANFEGLLYYNNSEWNIIHTPGISRITKLYRDKNGRIWTGGYNYMGYLDHDQQGKLLLKAVKNNAVVKGEVEDIWEDHNRLCFQLSNKNTFIIQHNKITKQSGLTNPYKENTLVKDQEPVNNQITLNNGLQIFATNGQGLIVKDLYGKTLYTITQKNGLCSNNINHMSYNEHGTLWGATDDGIFAISIPSAYSHFTFNEGLQDEVLSITKIRNQIYVGTLSGVYKKNGHEFTQVEGIAHACWQLAVVGSHILAATANGVYNIDLNNNVSQLTTASTTAILPTADGFYSGELDGVYLNNKKTGRKKICDAEKVVKILKDKNGTIWLQNLYGQIWKSTANGLFVKPTVGTSNDELATLVVYNKTITPITANATTPFPYPFFSYTDEKEIVWLTNDKGKSIYAFSKGKRQNEFSQIVYPLMDYPVRAMLRDGYLLWLGGDRGLNVVNWLVKDPLKEIKPKLFIRSMEIGDSTVWGGYGNKPSEITLKSGERHISFSYSVDFSSPILPTQYRYRINNGSWSAWDTDTQVEFNNQSSGNYLFEVQARDLFGNITETESFRFVIEVPFYQRWYMMVLYIIILAIFIYGLMRLRLRRLEKEKIRLESIVQERTTEVVKQKNEIEEKSKSLETALKELSDTQHELVRQEKMATAGKLTQGLIDRILNPLNYINNFAKLSEGLVNDIAANIEDEKEKMNQENYEDTADVLGMLKGNLQKVGEHGMSTARILKAMEELLKDRSGGFTKMSLTNLIRQNEEMLSKYFEKDLLTYKIHTEFEYTDTDVIINGNAEQLSKTVMSLLSNSVYALMKKAKRQQYSPELKLSMNVSEGKAYIQIHDNGTGIEDTIIDKIFDPFFTTKTTSEASGVGLYLSREIIQNHGGDITVTSKKDEYTIFTITIPTL